MSHISNHAIHLLIFYIFFSISKILFSLFVKNKKLFFSLLVYIYYYTSSNNSPSFLPLYLSIILYFAITLPLSFFSFLYFDYYSPHFILYKFDIISLIQCIFFPQKFLNTLFLSLGGFLFFLIIPIKVDGFFKYVFWYCVFLISHHKVFFLPFTSLVEFWFGLILSFFGNRNLYLYPNTMYMAMNLNMPTNFLNIKLL